MTKREAFLHWQSGAVPDEALDIVIKSYCDAIDTLVAIGGWDALALIFHAECRRAIEMRDKRTRTPCPST